jgi:hypothetical protein
MLKSGLAWLTRCVHQPHSLPFSSSRVPRLEHSRLPYANALLILLSPPPNTYEPSIDDGKRFETMPGSYIKRVSRFTDKKFYLLLAAGGSQVC